MMKGRMHVGVLFGNTWKVRIAMIFLLRKLCVVKTVCKKEEEGPTSCKQDASAKQRRKPAYLSLFVKLGCHLGRSS